MNRKFISLTTALAIILLSSVVALADSSDEAGVSSLNRLSSYEGYEVYDLVENQFQSESSSRAIRTLDDIYDLLTYALSGSGSTNPYSLPQIVTYTQRIGQILYGSGTSYPATSIYSLLSTLRTNSDTITASTNRLATMQTILDQIHFILNGAYNPTLYVRPDIQSSLFRTDFDSGDFVTISDDIYSTLQAANLIYAVANQIHSDGQNNSYYLSSLNSSVSSILSSLNSFNWLPYSHAYLGASLDLTQNWVQSYSAYQKFYFAYRFNTSVNPTLVRISLPAGRDGFNGENSFTLDAINATSDFSTFYSVDVPDYFFELSDNCLNLYLFNFKPFSNFTYYFSVSNPYWYQYYPTGTFDINYIPFDSDEYQQIAQFYYTRKSSLSFDSISSDLSAIRQVIASPDKVSAEQAQQAVESQVLDDFTGQGSESMSLSDVGGVKNVSSNAKQFLGTGSSGSNALSVFNVNGQGLWQWFSHTTADNLDTTSPTRGSDDYLSIYDQNMQNYLDGLGGDDYAR